MNEREAEEAVARALTSRGFRTMTSDQWTREGALDALREQRRRHAGSPRLETIDRIAGNLADRLTACLDVPPKDVATVLLAAGGYAGALAAMGQLSGLAVAEILQVTADVLDQRTDGGETP